MKILAIANQKGGVAKTTTAINLSSCLTELGFKVLAVDLDAQHSLTSGFNIENIYKSIYNCMKDELPLHEAIYKTNIGNLDIVPSTLSLANFDVEMAGVMGREILLRDSIEKSFEAGKLTYDYIIIDCNPVLNFLTLNALSAADSVIIPIEPGIFAFEGIAQLTGTIRQVKKKLNSKLNIKGVLLTRVVSRANISKEFNEQLKEVFGDLVFDTMIHTSVKIGDAQTNRQPINIYDKKSKSAGEYMELAKELIKRG